jgi:SAM-dependent methyltransferase
MKLRMTSPGYGQVDTDDPGAWLARETGQAAAYDRICDRYDEAFPHKEGQLACGDWLLANLPRGASVLDIGCGTGLPTARQMSAGGCAVTGVDISPAMLARARSGVPEARFVELDVVDLGRLPDRYDAAVAFFSLLNLPRRAMPQALELVHGALAPSGLFALAMVEAEVDDVPISFLGSRILVTGYLREDLRSLLHAARFSVEDLTAIPYAPASAGAAPEIQLFLNCRRQD